MCAASCGGDVKGHVGPGTRKLWRHVYVRCGRRMAVARGSQDKTSDVVVVVGWLTAWEAGDRDMVETV
jgi:hypothetical protein